MSDLGLLTLVHWLSPAFPLGSFAYSHGLETAIAQGDVTDADTLRDWIATILEHGAGRMDAALLCAAVAAAQAPGDAEARLDALAATARALAASSERLTETEDQGAAFARTVSVLTGLDHPARPLPVALGAAAAPLGLAPQRIAALYLQAMTGNLVSCGIRTVPLGQTEGQGVVAALAPLCLTLAEAATHTPPERIGGAAFRADLASMRHETQEVRLYRT